MTKSETHLVVCAQFVVAARKASIVQNYGEKPWADLVQQLRAIYAVDLRSAVKDLGKVGALDCTFSMHTRYIWGDLIDALEAAHKKLTEASPESKTAAFGEYSQSVQAEITKHIDLIVKAADAYVRDLVHHDAFVEALRKYVFAKCPLNFVRHDSRKCPVDYRNQRITPQPDVRFIQVAGANGPRLFSVIDVYVPPSPCSRRSLFGMSYVKVQEYSWNNITKPANCPEYPQVYEEQCHRDYCQMDVFLSRQEFNELVTTVYGPPSAELARLEESSRIAANASTAPHLF